MFLPFNSSALSLYSFFFCQFDEPNECFSFVLILDSSNSLLIFGSFNSFSSDLALGTSTIDFFSFVCH